MKAVLTCCFLSLTYAVFGQATGNQTNYPGLRSDASFIYSPKTAELLLLGGSTPTPESNQSDVWRWNGLQWSKISAAGPGSRLFFAMDMNTTNGRIEGFGGEGTNERSKDDL